MFYKAPKPELECFTCYETGFVFVRDESITSPILMRCTCERGAIAPAKYIPRWTQEIGAAMPRQRFPVEGFKPKLKDADSDSIIAAKIFELMSHWKNRIKFSEDYWKQQIENHRQQREGA